MTQTPDPRKIQIQIQGFLNKKAPQFMLELWKLLLDAQANPHGIPQSMIDEQKQKFMAGGSDAPANHNSRFDQGPSNNGRGGDYGGRGFENRGRGRGRVDGAAIGDEVVEVDSVVEDVTMTVRDVDTLRADVHTALDLEDVEVALEGHGRDLQDETIVHLHPDDAQVQSPHIEVVGVDHLREIGKVTIQVSSHPEQALLLIVTATMDEDDRNQGLPHARDHLLGDANAQDQIHDHPSKWTEGLLRSR